MSTTTAPSFLQYQVNQGVKPTGGLEGLSEKLIDQHWKLYEGYVTNSNLLNKSIWDAAEAGTEINKPNIAELQRRFGIQSNDRVDSAGEADSVVGKGR